MKTLIQSLILIFLLFSTTIIAQPKKLEIIEEQRPLYFEPIGHEQGLPYQEFNALFQDHLGFIWIGTPLALVKFNGYEFQSYFYEPDSMEENLQSHYIDVSSIAEDQNGNLWISCYFESAEKPFLFYYDRDQDQLRPFLFDKINLLEEGILQNISVQKNELWLLFSGRLVKVDISNFQEKPAKFPDFEVLKKGDKGFHPPIYHLFEDSKGRVWLPSMEGLNEWKPELDSFIYHPILPPKFKEEVDSNPFIPFMMEAEDGWFRLLPFLKPYLLHFHPDKGPGELALESTRLSTTVLLSTSSGQVWSGIRTGRGGLKAFDLNSNMLINTAPQIEGSTNGLFRVLSMLEDFSGNIWVGLQRGPLLKYTPQKQVFKRPDFQNAQSTSLNGISVTGIKQDKSGTYWISTNGGGLKKWDKNKGLINSFPNLLSTSSSIEDPLNLGELTVSSNGHVWVIHQSGRLFEFSPSTGQIKQRPLRAQTYNLWTDKQGVVWSSGGYLNRFGPEENDFTEISFTAGDTSQYLWIGALFQDSRNNLWIEVTQGMKEGFGRLNPSSKSSKWFNLPRAHSFTEDIDGHIWIGTEDGLFCYAPSSNSFQKFGVEDGLPTHNIQSLLFDEAGYLWIGTTRGLSQFNPREKQFRNYFASDGLPFHSFNRTSYKNQEGELFFGSDQDGLFYFHPDSLKKNLIPPKVTLTGIDLHGQALSSTPGQPLKKHISQLQKIRFPYHENDLSFHFAALHYKNPEKNRYKVRLLPYDQNWKDQGTKRFAEYTNLDPGRYTFEVLASNSDGIWTENPTTLEIIIRPPWWQTVWAYTIYAFLIGLFGYLLYRYLLNRQFELQEANRLRELDEVKTKLYTNISHEFRTPLTVISGMGQKILENPKKWSIEGGQLITRNSNYLLQLVNQILDLRKLESGSLKVQHVQSDIVSYLQYLMQSFHSLAENKDIRLHFYAEEKELVMDFDPNKIQHIFTNLLSNAIKYTPEGGDVYVRVEKDEGGRAKGEGGRAKDGSTRSTLQIKIRDTGIGIPEDQLPHIFDRFYQVDDSSTRKGEGTGIGLALTKELVQLLKGEISVKSQVNKGTEFNIQLPISNEGPLQETARDQIWGTAAGTAKEGTGKNLLNKSTAVADTNPLALIIEDNADVAKYIFSCLEDRYQLLWAKNGRQGIDMAFETVPDIIISDVMMPEKDGFEVCQTLKQDVRTSHIPIILLTAKADMESKLEGLRHGADAYLAKPFEPKELNIRLEQLIELRKKLQDRYRNTTSFKQQSGNIEDEFLKQLNQVIQDNISDENFGIQQLCRAIGLSRTQLHRKIKALTNKSTSIYIRSIRLAKARELLKSTKLNVSEIAYEVGFSNPVYFTQVFSEEFGVPPSEMR